MSWQSLILIRISRYEVERCETASVRRILHSFIPRLCERNRNQVQFEVLGYAEDPRELFDIPEVRAYFQTLFRQESSLFFWVETESYTLSLLALMLFEPIREAGYVTTSPRDRQLFLLHGFDGLNRFCRENGLSPEPTNRAISLWLGMETQETAPED